MFQVVVRLESGDSADAGSFASREEAVARVHELVRTAEGGSWLVVGDRFLRPGAVVSIDVHEGRPRTWAGSELRSTWGGGSSES